MMTTTHKTVQQVRSPTTPGARPPVKFTQLIKYNYIKYNYSHATLEKYKKQASYLFTVEMINLKEHKQFDCEQRKRDTHSGTCIFSELGII